MQKEFNVLIKPKKTSETSELARYLKDENIDITIKETLVKSRIKKILVDFLNVELKTSTFVNIINDIEEFINNLNVSIYVDKISEIKIKLLAKIIYDNIYFINMKYNLFNNLSELELYINDKLLLLIED